jgi:hypothetical protein
MDGFHAGSALGLTQNEEGVWVLGSASKPLGIDAGRERRWLALVQRTLRDKPILSVSLGEVPTGGGEALALLRPPQGSAIGAVTLAPPPGLGEAPDVVRLEIRDMGLGQRSLLVTPSASPITRWPTSGVPLALGGDRSGQVWMVWTQTSDAGVLEFAASYWTASSPVSSVFAPRPWRPIDVVDWGKGRFLVLGERPGNIPRPQLLWLTLEQ